MPRITIYSRLNNTTFKAESLPSMKGYICDISVLFCYKLLYVYPTTTEFQLMTRMPLVVVVPSLFMHRYRFTIINFYILSTNGVNYTIHYHVPIKHVSYTIHIQQ